MCMITQKTFTDDFKKKNANKDTIRVWKVYRVIDDSLFSPVMDMEAKRGIVQSNRMRKRINVAEDNLLNDRIWSITRGIHVFLTRAGAMNYMNNWRHPGQVAVCCHAQMKDLVAAERIPDYRRYVRYGTLQEAVFTKITISPRNWRRAVRGK